MDQGYRLSIQQTRLWQNRNLIPNAIAAFKFEGDLCSEKLRQAVHCVVEKYEIFHTHFRQVEGIAVPLQMIEQPEMHWLEPKSVNKAGGETLSSAELSALFNELDVSERPANAIAGTVSYTHLTLPTTLIV